MYSNPDAARRQHPPATPTRLARETDLLADWLVDVVEARFELPRGTLCARPRHSMRGVQARQIAAYLLNTELGLSQSECARRLGRHRSTVEHSLRRMEDSRDDPVFNAHLDVLGTTLKTLRGALA